MARRISWMFLFVTMPVFVNAQTDTARVSWFPRTLLFMPLLANHEEPVIGLEQQLGSTALRVGIGNTVDLFEYHHGSDTVRWGADFFSFSLASTIREVRLKIDAADGFFGMHFAWTNGPRWMVRFRVLHQSAHFVDGHYDLTAGTWNDNRKPIPFSRNYGEVVATYGMYSELVAVRAYAGPSFAVYNNPKDIRRWGGIMGFEVRALGRIPLYAAYNLSLLGVPRYDGSNSLEAGLKFGDWNGRGIRLYVMYYSGLDLFGEYYKDRKEFVGAGFAIDFW